MNEESRIKFNEYQREYKRTLRMNEENRKKYNEYQRIYKKTLYMNEEYRKKLLEYQREYKRTHKKERKPKMTEEELKVSLKESGKKYYLNNREKIIKRVVNYQKFNTNPEKKLKRKEYLKAHGAAYYIKNKDKMTNKYKEYYMNNSDKVKEYQKEYYMNNSDKVKEYQKEYQKEYREKRRAEKIRIKEKSLAYQNSIMNDYHIHKNKYYEFCI